MQIFRRNRAEVNSDGEIITPRLLTVPPELYESRMATCTACEEYNLETRRCNECGCYMQWKAQLKYSSCPQEKW